LDKYVKGTPDIVIDEAKKPKIRTFWKDEAGPETGVKGKK